MRSSIAVRILLSAALVVAPVSCSSTTDASGNNTVKATADELGIVATYQLQLVNGNAVPVETSGGYTGTAAPFGQCDLVIDSGSLQLKDDLSYSMSRTSHYRCPNGTSGPRTDTTPFTVTVSGAWSYANGNLALSQTTNTDFTILAAKVTTTSLIAVDMSLAGCAPNPGFVCVAVPEIVFKFGK